MRSSDCGCPRRAVSSVVEHYNDTVGVTGSNPVPPTISQVHNQNQLPKAHLLHTFFGVLVAHLYPSWTEISQNGGVCRCSLSFDKTLAQGNHVNPKSGRKRWDSRAFLDLTGGGGQDFGMCAGPRPTLCRKGVGSPVQNRARDDCGYLGLVYASSEYPRPPSD